MTVDATAPNAVRKFLRLVMIEHSVFALPFAYIAALTAMWRETRSVHWVQLLLDHHRDGVGADGGHGRQSHPRPQLRRPQSAHRPARAGHRRGVPAFGLDGAGHVPGDLPGQRRRAVVAVPGPVADRDRVAGAVLVRQAVHRLPAGAARSGPVRRSGRRLDRRHRPRELGRRRAGHRGRHLDRRLRPDLRLSGPRGRPAHRRAVGAGAVRDRRRARGVVGRARDHAGRRSSGSEPRLASAGRGGSASR